MKMQGGEVRPLTREIFEGLAGSGEVARTVAEIADAREAVLRGEMSKADFETFKRGRKGRLPVITPHATFADGRRSDAGAVPSGLYMLDVDHMEGSPRVFFDERVRARVAELGIVLGHVTPSGEGLRLVAVLPEGFLPGLSPDGLVDAEAWKEAIAGAQAWLAHMLGDVAYDGATRDLARCSFVVPRDYVLYVDDGLFGEAQALNPPSRGTGYAPEQEDSSSLASREDVGAPSNPSPTLNDSPSVASREDVDGSGGLNSYKGIAFADIVARYWELTGGVPEEGERNVKLYRLACHLRAVCDNRWERLLEVMPCLGLGGREMEALCKSACREPVRGSALMSEIVAELGAERSLEAGAGAAKAKGVSLGSLMGRSRLPAALRASLAGVPEGMQFAVVAAVLPIAGALADGVEVEYCDGQRQRLSLMSIVLGDQASGKSVCKQVADLWKRPLELEDADARKVEDEWKARKKNRKANERCPEDPRVLIRVLPVTVSCSTLLRRLKNSRGHTLYSFGEELDTLRKTNGAGSWSSKYDVYRLGFDYGEWGQDYNSDQAESGTVNVAYNWTMLGTYGALRRCFSKDNVENGLSSRVLVAEMPDNSFAPMPRYGQRSAAHEAAIAAGVELLRGARGFVDTPRLRKAIGEWVEQKRLEAMADIDRVKDTYRKRAAVIGFRAGVVCHLLSGEQRELRSTLKFATAVAEMALRGQIRVFGEALAKQLDEKAPVQVGCNMGVFDCLPDEFTMGDIRRLKRGACNDASMRSITSRWAKAGWVEKTDAHHWRKLRSQAPAGKEG